MPNPTDEIKTPAYTQAQIDASLPNRAGSTLYKLAKTGNLRIDPVTIGGPQYAKSDGSLLLANQTFYSPPAAVADAVSSGLVVVGP
jgi:hypothetical protein